MKTTSVYHGFAMQYEELNKQIVQRVIATAPVERLYLLGLTIAYNRTETLFSLQSATRREVDHYYLLALVNKEDDLSLNSVQDKIEGNLQHLLPVTVIVLSETQFFKWLLEGHPFASEIYHRGYQLYQKEEVQLPYPATVNKEVIQKESTRLFAQTKTRIQEFLAGAELYTIRLQYKMAAFMLHQTVEQALRTMLILNAGLRINTHSIDRLIRYCTMFCFELPDVFPRRNEKEKHLFQLLQKAYVDSRYKDDYSIKLDELAKLTAQVKKLYAQFQKNGRSLGSFN